MKNRHLFFFMFAVYGTVPIFAQGDNTLKFSGFIQIDGRFIAGLFFCIFGYEVSCPAAPREMPERVRDHVIIFKNV